MPTYVYETIPQNESEQPVQFEIRQKMADKPLTEHPDTGQPVRRIITAAASVGSSKGDSSGGCCASKCGCG